MNSDKIFLLVVLTLFFCIGQAQMVTELHYKTVTAKKSAERLSVVYGKDFAKIQLKPVHARNPARYIDKKSALLIMDFEGSRDYIIEESDSVYKIDAVLDETGETQVINGYNCKKYTTRRISKEQPANGLFYSNWNYQYKIWITTDLLVDETYSRCISHTQLPLPTFDYKGVIVKIEDLSMSKQPGYTILDSVVKAKEPLQDFVRPWLKTYERDKKPVAILPGGSNSNFDKATSDLVGPGASTTNPSSSVSASRALTIGYTQEDIGDQHRRMKALLIKTTGFVKPDWKGGFEGIVF